MPSSDPLPREELREKDEAYRSRSGKSIHQNTPQLFLQRFKHLVSRCDILNPPNGHRQAIIVLLENKSVGALRHFAQSSMNVSLL